MEREIELDKGKKAIVGQLDEKESLEENGKTHQEPLGSIDRPHGGYLPNSSWNPWILLAQDLLGLHDEEPRRSSQAAPDLANDQPSPRHHHVGVGMATGLFGWFSNAQEHRGETCDTATGSTFRGSHLPRNESSDLLHNRDGCLLLGIQ